MVIIGPVHMKRWQKVKSGQVGVGSNIFQNQSSSLYEVMKIMIISDNFFSNSHEKLTKIEIM